MFEVDKYFKEKAKKISFLELKDDAHIQIGGQLVDTDIPLPIFIDTLVEGIKSKTINEEIKVSHIIEGLIYIMGVDPSFKYNDNYKQILVLYDSKIENYIFYKGFKYLSEEKFEEAIIYFRALLNINPNNLDGLFNYGICLEEIAKRMFELNMNNKGEAFLIKATNSFETILDIEPDYYLAYYKLGYHYKNSGQFLKATLIWEKYMLMDNDKDRKQEIREELDIIQNDSLYEEGCNLYFSGSFDEALEKFLKIESRLDNWWNLKYMIGLTYKEMDEIEKAIDYFYEALELNEEVVDIYNELGICLFAIGKFNEALEVFNTGIEIDDKNYKILFNRGIAYYQIGFYDKAISDVEIAYELNPSDPMIRKFKENLENIK